MTLLDRIRPTEDGGGPSTKTISFHAFSSGLYLLTRGMLTLNQFKNIFNLDATDDTQITALQDHYTGLSAEDKRSFRDDVESLGILWEGNYITEAQFKTGLGIA